MQAANANATGTETGATDDFVTVYRRAKPCSAWRSSGSTTCSSRRA